MKSSLIWFVLYSLVWLAGMAEYIPQIGNEYWRLLSLSGFYLIFFVVPLFKKRQRALTLLFCVQIVLAILTLYPVEEDIFNPYILLIITLQAGEMVQRLGSFIYYLFPAMVQAAGITVLAVQTSLQMHFSLFLFLYIVLLNGVAALYHSAYHQRNSALARYDALLTEYRGLKRRLASEEELTRQEERMLIGHEIHDSVGHKLTALLMQLEVYRLKAGQEEREQVQTLKKLAQDSLDETRRAVKNYKQRETGGLQGIMRLIRNLESNSFLRVHFTVNHGAFSPLLNGEQSFVIYRSVQEALTNIMKHSKAREAKVMFEAPGGSLFRFEISNPFTDQYPAKEGFGLQSMRERLQKFGGNLEVFQTSEQFVVRGWLRIAERGDIGD